MRRAVAGGLALLAALVVLTWLGFRFPSSPSPPPGVDASRLIERTVVWDGLPPGVQFYLTQSVGRTPFVTSTAVLWGSGSVVFDLGVARVRLPVRWREAIDASRGYVWSAEVLWWCWPLLEMEDRLVDGVGTVRIGRRRISSPHIQRGQVMRAHAERIWLPSMLLTDPDITWQARDTWTAVMRFPVVGAPNRNGDAVSSEPVSGAELSGGTTSCDSLIAQFDPRTRALLSLSGTRTGSGSSATTWSLACAEWDAPGGLTVPVAGHAAWDGVPYYRFRVEGIRYNVPVEPWFEQIRAGRQ